MSKKLIAGFMAALMALVTAISPVLATTALEDYPSVLGVDRDLDAYIVVGATAASADVVGAVDLAVRLAELSYREVTVGGAVLTGVETEDIPFDTNISSGSLLKSSIKHYDVPDVLQDSSVDFSWDDGSDTYDFQEVITVSNLNSQQVETSSTKSKDYEDSPALHIASAGLKYTWQFDENFNTSKISSTYPLEIEILGTALKVTAVGANQFTATLAEEYYLTVGESVTVEGKTITLLNVGSASAVVDVDGTSEIVSTGATKTINGIKVKTIDVLSRTELSESAATLQIGESLAKTYKDEDPYIGESKTDPNWKWELGDLNVTAGASVKPKIAVKYAKTLNIPSKNPPEPGDALVFPNDYIQLSFDATTTHTLATYTIEYITEDLSNAGGPTDATTIKISSTATSDPFYVIAQSVYSDTIYLYKNATAALNNKTYVFYEDTDNHVQYAELTDGTASDNFADITYQDTTFNIKWLLANTTTITESQTTPAAGVYTITPLITSNLFAGLDTTVNKADGAEINVYGTDMGTRDEDILTNYGAVIRAPKSNAGADRVVIDIPSSQVKATLTVGAVGGAAVVAGETEQVIVGITSPVAVLDTEVTSTHKAKNLVLIGGPCVNTLVADLASEDKFDYTCDTWPGRDFGLIKAIDDAFVTGKIALVVAGTTSDDTRTASTVLQQYDTLLVGQTSSAVEVTAATTAGITAV